MSEQSDPTQHRDEQRGNLDGSTAADGPRDESLDQARGNGSFDSSDEVPAGQPHDEPAAGEAADAGDSGQDSGSMS